MRQRPRKAAKLRPQTCGVTAGEEVQGSENYIWGPGEQSRPGASASTGPGWKGVTCRGPDAGQPVQLVGGVSGHTASCLQPFTTLPFLVVPLKWECPQLSCKWQDPASASLQSDLPGQPGGLECQKKKAED